MAARLSGKSREQINEEAVEEPEFRLIALANMHGGSNPVCSDGAFTVCFDSVPALESFLRVIDSEDLVDSYELRANGEVGTSVSIRDVHQACEVLFIGYLKDTFDNSSNGVSFSVEEAKEVQVEIGKYNSGKTTKQGLCESVCQRLGIEKGSDKSLIVEAHIKAKTTEKTCDTDYLKILKKLGYGKDSLNESKDLDDDENCFFAATLDLARSVKKLFKGKIYKHKSKNCFYVCRVDPNSKELELVEAKEEDDGPVDRKGYSSETSLNSDDEVKVSDSQVKESRYGKRRKAMSRYVGKSFGVRVGHSAPKAMKFQRRVA